MSFTDIFGGQTLPPTGLSYTSLTLTSDLTLLWPYNTDSANQSVSKVMQVSCNAGNSLILPDATEVSTGEDFLIRNVGANTLTVKDSTGVQVATVAAGAASYFYLTNNSTAAGVFGVIGFGVGTSSVDASSLVGYGIKAVGMSLNQSHPVIPTASAITLDNTHRAKLVVFTGGTGTFSLTSAATLGDDYFTLFRNDGTGTVTIDPASTETIDGLTTMSVQPGESLILICTGAVWYSVGYGRSVLYQFTQLTKDVSAGGTITLTAAEASNKLITFIGSPAGAVNVVVPSVVAVYYLQSSLSTAQTVTVKTSAGSGVGVSQGARIIALCDATNVVSAQSVVANSSISLTDGSAVTPSLYFATKTNTGLYKSGTQDFGVTINGVSKLVIGSTGPQTSTLGPTSAQQHTVPAVTSDTFALLAAAQTLTNKTLSLGSNTLSGTLAQFNSACSDADFAPVASPSFTGSIGVPSGTVGTPGLRFTADGATDTGFYWVSDGVIGVANNAVNTGQFTPTGINSMAIGATTPSTGAFTTLSASGVSNFAAQINTGTGVSTGDVFIEHGSGRTGSGNVYIDLHATSGSDYEARLMRNGGVNGALSLVNTGTGDFLLTQTGAGWLKLQTNNLDRLQIDSTGNSIIALVNKMQVKSATYPTLELYATGSGVNQKFARVSYDSGTFRLEYVNDAYSAVTLSPLTIDASGNALFNGANCNVTAQGTGGFGAFYAKGSGTNNSYLFFGNAGGEKGRIGVDDAGNVVFSNTTGVTTRMTIQSDGVITTAQNLGIGVAPSAPAGFARFMAIGDSDTGIGQISDGVLALATNNVIRMKWDAAGLAGLGCTPGGNYTFETAGIIGASATSNGGADFLVADNLSTAANTTKFSGLAFFGRDTVNVRKQTALIRCLPNDNDYIGSSLAFYARASDSVVERFRAGPSGEWGIAGANYGTAGQVLTSGGSGAAPSWSTASGITQMTVQSPTGSGIATFTGIPSTAKRIVVAFVGMSTSSSSGGPIKCKIGPVGGVENTGYLNGLNSGITSYAHVVNMPASTSATVQGVITITLLDAATNRWMIQTEGSSSSVAAVEVEVCSKTLASTLERLTLETTVGNWDAGSVNVQYQ